MRPADSERADPGDSPDLVRVLVRALPPGAPALRARTLLGELLRKAGLREDDVSDAEIVVTELVANGERHACPPFELRVFFLGDVPVWCEVLDGDPGHSALALVTERLRSPREPDPLAEDGRGLLLAHRLTQGRCRAYPTRALTTGTPAKAVAFALPMLSREHRTAT